MLNGLDPIILFHYSKKVPTSLGFDFDIPLISAIEDMIDFPPIPIYLSESLFGIVIDQESKNIDIATEIETLSDGSAPKIHQKGASSQISIQMKGKKDSIPLTLLSAFLDQAFDKATSGEYAITYLHGATTLFRGLLKSYAVDTQDGTDLQLIKIELTSGESQPQKPASVPSPPPVTNKIIIPGAA